MRTYWIIFLPAASALGSPHFITSRTLFGGETHDRACVPLRLGCGGDGISAILRERVRELG